MTGRLYYDDSYRRTFAAAVTSVDGTGVYLDATTFYPASGGQPFDMGSIGEARVVEVIDEGDRIRHVLDRELAPGAYECAIDWPRRFDHMQQHTGQHLLSAVFEEAYGMSTVSFHLGSEAVTIDLATPSLSAAQMAEAERRANDFAAECRPVTVSYHESAEGLGLRKPPDREGRLRVVTIEDLDRSACGGTHVRSTAEIGPIVLRKLDKVRGNVRLEFACGLRAMNRARADYRASEDAREAATAKLADSEKLRRKLALELAAVRGRELWASAAPGANGLRVHVCEVPGALEEELRAEAQNFLAGGGAVFIAAAKDPPAVLYATSTDSGIAAGARLKPLLEKYGGRGGGNPQIAQGSLPDAGAVAAVIAALSS
ncbi:MAG: alanyl-tRNA editing protein [Bryobacteraceae bacterium]